MIPIGIIASAQHSAEEGAPGWLPEGAIGYIDQSNERYYANGVVADTDIFGDFEGTPDADGDYLIGPMLALFQAPFTVVIQAAADGGNVFQARDMAESNLVLLTTSTSDFSIDVYYDNLSVAWFDDPTSAADPSRKVALTIDTTNWALSNMGDAVITSEGQAEPDQFLDIEQVSFPWSSREILVVYPPQANAALPALAALP